MSSTFLQRGFLKWLRSFAFRFTLMRPLPQPLRSLIIIPLLSLAIAGCTTVRGPQAELTLQVAPAGQPGVYHVSGTTNLPEHSRILVTCLRNLHSAATESTNYSILGRQTTEVAQGKWQATLNLWEVAPDGRYREAWQLTSPLQALTPSDQVAVIATFDPAQQADAVAQSLKQEPREFRSPLIRFTTEGQQYLQATETLTVSLPTGKTTPPTLTSAAMNGGWGTRSELPPTQVNTGQVSTGQAAPPRPSQPQTNAPLSPSAFFR